VEYEEIVRRTVAEIARRLDDPPDFRELAARSFVSPYHFHRIFHAMVGESPRELARRLRLERAAHRLRDTGTAIVDIAAEAGYATPEAFAKSFQAEFEAAPSAFRAGRRDCLGIRARSGVHYVDGGFTVFHPVHKGGPDMKVETVEVPRQRVAAVRHTGPYWQIGKAFGELGPRAGALGLTGLTVAAFYDDPETVPEAELRSVAGVLVPDGAAIGDLEEVWLPGGRFLKAEYFGHPSGLPQAWARLYREFVPDGDHRLRDDVTFEVYVSTHDSAAAEQMQTDLYLPIA
jgi:AraC family transcriptional regulator